MSWAGNFWEDHQAEIEKGPRLMNHLTSGCGRTVMLDFIYLNAINLHS